MVVPNPRQLQEIHLGRRLCQLHADRNRDPPNPSKPASARGATKKPTPARDASKPAACLANKPALARPAANPLLLPNLQDQPPKLEENVNSFTSISL